MSQIFILFLLVGLTSSFGWASPVTYKDGVALHLEATRNRYDLDAFYSPTRRFSFGPSYSLLKYNNQWGHFFWPQVNVLLHRWNMEKAQANVYSFFGLGFRDHNKSQNIVGMLGGQADFETRRIYTSLQHQSLLSTDDLFVHRLQYRLGVAPYLANFRQLNTWLIGALFFQPHENRELIFIPALRFFYANIFIEGGSSFQGDWMGRLMIHF